MVWSRCQPLASVGAVLSLLDGPTGCDPAFCEIWFRFRLLRRYLALWPTEVGGVHRLLEMVGEGSPGHGLVHLLAASAAEIGFMWDLVEMGWSRPGLPLLGNLAGPNQHFKAAILDACAADLCGREGFRGGPLLDVHGFLQLLNSSHVRERDTLPPEIYADFLGREREGVDQLMPLQFLAPVDFFFLAVERLQLLTRAELLFVDLYSFARVVCHVHTLLLGRELSTIVEGQGQGTVHIMESYVFQNVFFLRNVNTKHVHIHIHIHIQIHVYFMRVYTYMCVYVCIFVLFVVWCRVMSCAARCWVVGWLGVVLCGVVWCGVCVLLSIYCNGQERSVQ